MKKYIFMGAANTLIMVGAVIWASLMSRREDLDFASLECQAIRAVIMLSCLVMLYVQLGVRRWQLKHKTKAHCQVVANTVIVVGILAAVFTFYLAEFVGVYSSAAANILIAYAAAGVSVCCLGFWIKLIDYLHS